jgi:hypothetical protein
MTMIKPQQVAPLFLVVAILAAIGAAVVWLRPDGGRLPALLAGVAAGSLIVSGVAAWIYRKSSDTPPAG